MESGLLYTFSTIAQALGGAFALLAAFVLYRLASLDSSMLQDTQILTSFGLTGEINKELQAIRARNQYEELLRRIETHVRYAKDNPTAYQLDAEKTAMLIRFRMSVRQRRPIVVALWIALWVTVIEMSGSVWAIPHSHDWAAQPRVAHLALCVGVSGFVLCLLLYMYVIWVALRNPRAPSIRA
jgi:hypothetical protein